MGLLFHKYQDAEFLLARKLQKFDQRVLGWCRCSLLSFALGVQHAQSVVAGDLVIQDAPGVLGAGFCRPGRERPFLSLQQGTLLAAGLDSSINDCSTRRNNSCRRRPCL
jgi:hypothetical protein